MDQTYDLLQCASAAVVTSGTATLETALFSVPEVVCYKANWFSYLIARWLIRVKHISLVNLVMDKEVVKELIQREMTAKNIQVELGKVLYDAECQRKLLEDYDELQERLGNAGASAMAAEVIRSATANQ